MQNKKDELYFGGHLVAFLDILGQSANLSGLKKTKWWELDKGTISALQDTYGRVLRFRKIFNGFLLKFCRPSVLDSVFEAAASPEQLNVWNPFDQSRILKNDISDSIIMILPLMLTSGLAPLKSIYGVLGACASSMLASLNYSFAFRGAVEIGPCVFDPRTNEVYGSALNDVVRYEKEACWPRVIVGPELLNYLVSCTKLPEEPVSNRINKSTAQLCLSLITKDDSEVHFIDFMGDGFKQLQKHEDTDKMFEGASKFINSQIQHYGSTHHIGSKYSKLKEYFEPKLKGF